MLVLYTALCVSITITIHNISYEETRKKKKNNQQQKKLYLSKLGMLLWSQVNMKEHAFCAFCIIQSLGKNNVVEPELLPEKGLKQ